MRPAIAMIVLCALARPASAQVWEYGLSGFVFDPPHGSSYFSPIAYGDHAGLHLEARYNYENLETGSGFVGWNCAAGGEIALAVTPMVGLVAGKTNGVAPGLEADITWKRLAL